MARLIHQEDVIRNYGPRWTTGVISEHLDLAEQAGLRLRITTDGAVVTNADGETWPVLCSEIVRIDTEDGPISGRCGMPAIINGETPIWCEGHDFGTAWLEDESPVVLAAVQDKQSEYGPAHQWAVEKAVKGSYEASAQAVAGHLIAEGKWDPTTRTWNPINGVTAEMMDSAIEPFNFSNAVRGYYPQKAIAAGFLGSITKAVRSASRRKAKAA